ncbi:MAG: hypothetical protein GXY19_01145 [Phycisphaerae bacterium]|nr:hypothetical protein [Phycisphaerae bacterium]
MNLRKFAIGFVVLGAVILAYLAFMQAGGGPVMDADLRDQLAREVSDGNAASSGRNLGRIGDVGVGGIRHTHLFHTDQTGRIDREFGFEQLLYSEGDQWRITHPWMSLLLGPVNCRITADRGELQLDTAFDQPTPHDATFTGNVVIRVTPTDPNNPLELFVYLDDLAFIADSSLFSTTGAVRFVSRYAQLTGRGMDLLYDEAQRRLELFRVKELENLRLRSDLFASLPESAASNAASDEPEAEAAEVAVAGADARTVDANEGGAPDYYECVLHRNVIITTPEQKVTVRDRLVIDNILWAGPASPEAETAGPSAVATAAKTEPNAAEPNEPPSPVRKAMDTSPSPAPALDAIPPSFFDIVVTCHGGLVIAPKGSPSLEPDLGALGLDTAASPADASEPTAVDPNRQSLVAHRIDFDASTTDTMLTGPVRMTYALDPNDLTGRDSGGQRMPVTVSAEDSVRFIAASTRVELDGNCIVTLHQTEPNYAYEYMLTAPRLAVDLFEDPNAKTGKKSIGLKRFEASGGPVAVRALRHMGDELIGWVELHSRRLDYEGREKTFAVTGPGEIRLHNGQAPEIPVEPNEFSLRQPCFAFMRDFDSLAYSAQTNTIVADAVGRQILLDYIPQIDGSYKKRHVEADAGRIEIALTQTERGRMELLSLTASEGIRYEDPLNRFDGAILFYDHPQTLVTVNGDGRQSCSFNGAYVDRIRMNLTTGATKAEVLGPSTIQIRP